MGIVSGITRTSSPKRILLFMPSPVTPNNISKNIIRCSE